MTDIASQVRALLNSIRDVIGVGNKFRIRWDRTGAAQFEFIGGDRYQWTTERIYGKLGRFSAECQGLPSGVAVNNPYLQYEVHGSDLRLVAGVDLPGMADRLSPASCNAAGPVGLAGNGAVPVGSIGLLTIFSALSLVWSLLHPRITLNLPGNMEADLTLTDADTLFVEFVTPPSVTVVFGLSFSGEPNSLTLRERSAEIAYRAAVFSRVKKWAW